MPITRARVHVQSVLFSLVFVFLPLPFCLSRDTITLDNPISDHANETLVSANGVIELGFFTPNGISSARRYVGIWYSGYSPFTVVWVSNRDYPSSNSTAFFGLAEDGNVAVWASSQWIWSSGLEGKKSINWTLRLMDTGNLIPSGVRESQVLWQSFDHPTDTFLPGMSWSENSKLTSWNASDDPKLGNFTFQVDPDMDKQYRIKKQDAPFPYWKSGVYAKLQGTDDMISMISCRLNSSCHLSKNSEVIWPTRNGSKVIKVDNLDFFNHTRLVINWMGQIQFYGRDDASAPWNLYGHQPEVQVLQKL